MNRRRFLGLAAVAAFTLDPERLLWRPGTRTIFLPPYAESKIPLFKKGDWAYSTAGYRQIVVRG